MGRVQAEIFKSVVQERFDTAVELDAGRVLYRETIKNTVEGVGHFEPLRHYAEVHLLLEPLPAGSGLSFDSICPEDALDRNWQRLILTHLAEKQHRGVLTGAPITDMRITLASGKAHLKHTEGGDFRQATYRAVRQGLMQAESVLLEPWYSFALEVPAEQIGRAISDVRAMNGSFSSPEERGDFLRLEGAAPAAKLLNYMEELVAWSHGRGRLSLTPCGYRPCADQKRIVEEIGYEPERDEENPADSVFCAHGAGTVIPWDQVREYMHIDTGFGREKTPPPPAPRMFRRNLDLDDRVLEEIMQREFGPIRRKEYRAPVVNAAEDPAELFHRGKQRIIVDG
jgi:translation elongation factor EF-G